MPNWKTTKRAAFAALWAALVGCLLATGLSWHPHGAPPETHARLGAALNTSVYGYRTIQQDGAAAPQRDTLNFVGGATVADDPDAGVTVVTAGGGGGSTSYANVYGDGSDGTATCDGSTSVAGMTLSGSTYALSRDVYFASLTVNSGISVYVNGFRVFVSGTLTLNGTIESNGGTADAGSGAGGMGGNVQASFQNSKLGIGGNGGATGSGANGLSTAMGGQGGGETAPNTAATAPPAYLGAPRDLTQAQDGWLFGLNNGNATHIPFNGGAGGSAGNGTCVGGGGGGVVVVSAFTIAGSGSITANGGAANGGGSANPWCSFNAGGGWAGGGGGGAAVLIYHIGTGWSGGPPRAYPGTGSNLIDAGISGVPNGAGLDGGFGFTLAIQT